MTDENVRDVAISKRMKRMRSQLGFSALGCTAAEMVIRKMVSGGAANGTNMLFFAGLAVVIYYTMKAYIVEGETSSFAWQGRNPWLWIFWPLAIALVIGLQLRFFLGM